MRGDTAKNLKIKKKKTQKIVAKIDSRINKFRAKLSVKIQFGYSFILIYVLGLRSEASPYVAWMRVKLNSNNSWKDILFGQIKLDTLPIKMG